VVNKDNESSYGIKDINDKKSGVVKDKDNERSCWFKDRDLKEDVWEIKDEDYEGSEEFELQNEKDSRQMDKNKTKLKLKHENMRDFSRWNTRTKILWKIAKIMR